MRVLDETVAALGTPLSRVALDDWNGRKTVVARWRHHDALIARSAADALRVALSLGFEQNVHYTEPNQATSAHVVPGDLAPFPSGAPSRTLVEGPSDIVQIFVDAANAPEVECWPTAKAFLPIASEDLRASALSLFMAARTDGGARPHRSAAMLMSIVHQLLALRGQGGNGSLRGGLQPATLRRIDRLIAERLRDPHGPHPTVGDLAAEARLSPNHFIRAFRQTTGTTPHQYIMTRRRQRAIALLHEPKSSIAEIGDTLGFSSAAHFVAAFRQRFGVTPGAYRRAVADPDVCRER